MICNPEVADLLVTVEQQYLEELEKRLQKKIIVQAKKRFHLEKFEIVGQRPGGQSGAGSPRRRADAEDARRMRCDPADGHIPRAAARTYQ